MRRFRLRNPFRKSLRSYLTRHNLMLLCIAILLLGGGFFLWAASLSLPDMRGVEGRRVEQSTKIYDRTGEILLYDLSKDVTRTVVPISQISPNIQKATVAIEDTDFYRHHGFKPTAFLRAVIVNITTLHFSQGGSTITQQVIKNALLTKDKSPARKLKEIILALKLERVMTKDQILELYLNENPYGGSISGVEEASRSFFGKKASDVTLAEAAYLAALPQRPSYYSPYGNHKDALDQRKNLVLDRMLAQGVITQQEHDAAKNDRVTFLPQRAHGIIAPHFVFYVAEQLEEKYGSTVLENGGLKVITTLDADMQTAAETIVKRRALKNTEDFNATNAALVAIDPKTGEILTMVGSRDYFDTKIPGSYNIALAERQPGSSFKPFVYATAFQKGYTPDTVLFDVPTQFSTSCNPSDTHNITSPCYAPQNYDNKFRGPVTLRNALAQSLNVPSVKLLYLTGINSAIQTAKAFGVTTLKDASQYGLTLVLGGGEVRLLDMVSGYGTFATNGYHFEPHAILEVDDANGNIIDRPVPSGSQVLPEYVAMEINDVLSDNTARIPAYGANSPLYFPGRDVAVKTGTTNDSRDAWIIGYTPNLVVGAWAGNNDNSPMVKKVAGQIVAPMWNEFMQGAIATRTPESFTRQETDESGLPPILRGIWQGGDVSQQGDQEIISGGVHSILYWIDKDNPTGGRPANPGNDPQFRYWEYGVRIWAENNGYGGNQQIVNPLTPTSLGNGQGTPTEAAVQQLRITDPAQGSSIDRNTPVEVRIESSSEISSVSYSINGSVVGSVSRAPFSITFVPSALQLQGINSIHARATTATGGVMTAQTTFTVR
jgi:1A family penicillin-binding protein